MLRLLAVVGAALGVLTLAAAVQASSPPVGPVHPGPATIVHTHVGSLVAVALPAPGHGLSWRQARAVNPKVLVETTEANVGSGVVVVFRARGAGHVRVVYASTRGESRTAHKAIAYDLTVTR